MDASQPLTIESFSYSWLVNLKPSQDSLDSSLRTSLELPDEASFIEMDPRLPPSKRFFRRSDSRDFKFDSPTSEPPLKLVHADELFSGGYVLPVFADPLKIKSYKPVFYSSCNNPSFTHHAKFCSTSNKGRSPTLRRCATLSKQTFHKYFQLFRPLCQIIQRCKSSSKRANSRSQASRTSVYPADSSPRISTTSSVDNWRRSCDSDGSIYEAVLHCKKSFGK